VQGGGTIRANIEDGEFVIDAGAAAV